MLWREAEFGNEVWESAAREGIVCVKLWMKEGASEVWWTVILALDSFLHDARWIIVAICNARESGSDAFGLPCDLYLFQDG